MKNIKKIISLCLCCFLIIGLCACKKKEKDVKYDPVKEEDSTVYTIYIMQDDDSEYHNQILKGYQDALNDLFGASHLDIKYSKGSDDVSLDAIAEAYAVTTPQLIFANGANSVTSMATAEQTTPIVGADVINYEGELDRIEAKKTSLLNSVTTDDTTSSEISADTSVEPTDEDSQNQESTLFNNPLPAPESWDGTTGINLCGVSTLPDIEASLSLLIECTPVLYSVGVIYPEGDEDAKYQADIMKKYVEQAGLVCNEYILPPSSDMISEYSINSTLSDSVTTDQVLKMACENSNCLYIPSSVYVDDQIEKICNTATANGIPTVTNDLEASNYALASLYQDPYMIGYAAGKMSYRVLVKKEDPSTTLIENVIFNNEKLYNENVANALGKTFPKSFKERTKFLEEYVPGSTTERVNNQEASQ